MSHKGFGPPPPEDNSTMREQLNKKLKGLKRLLKSPVIIAGLTVPKKQNQSQ